MTNTKFGCLPSPRDERDFPVSAFLPVAAPMALPESFALPVQLPIYDQGATSMCCDYSCRELKEIQEWVERGAYEPMANGYVYGNRAPDDYRGEGMYPRQALDRLLKYGIPPAFAFTKTGTYEECRAAYESNKAVADDAARPQQVKSYVRCNSPVEVQRALVELRSPVLIAIAVTKRFAYRTPATGAVPVEPAENFRPESEEFLGGHAMIVTGYRTVEGVLCYEVQNSWGTGWGNQGRCYLRTDYPGIWELWAVTDRSPRGKMVRLPIGGNQAELVATYDDGQETTQKPMLVAPFIKDGRTFLPIRDITNALVWLFGKPIAVHPVTDAAGNVLAVELTALEA